MNQLFDFILKLNIPLTVLILLILVTRGIIRKHVNSSYIVKLWMGIPVCCLTAYLISALLRYYPDINVSLSEDMFSGIIVTEQEGGTAVFANVITASRHFNIRQLLAWVWAGGLILKLTFCRAHYVYLKKKVYQSQLSVIIPGPSMYCKRNVLLASDSSFSGSFLFGYLQPVIFISCKIDREMYPAIIRHELTHILQKDNWKKTGMYLFFLISWMNPLVYPALYYLSLDLEYACDETVTMDYSKKQKSAYLKTLLTVSDQTHMGVSNQCRFESGIKKRVKNLLQKKKPFRVLPVLLTAVIFISSVGCGILTNTSISESFSYPERADDMSLDAYKQACRIDQDILSKMSTEALISAVISYPFITDVFLYSTDKTAMAAIESECDAFRELKTREGWKEALSLKIDQLKQNPKEKELLIEALDFLIRGGMKMPAAKYDDE